MAEEKLFGGSPAGDDWALGARDGGELLGVAAGAAKWIRLLAVRPDARRKGIGTALLRGTRAADQPGNYLAPGIDERDVETIAWLERRGFAREGANVNLVVSTRVERRDVPGYEIRRARAEDLAIAATFSPAWAFEVARADVFVAASAGEVVAFAAHDGNNRGLGWFGPAGTLAAHRGKGLGEALLRASLADVAHERAEIAWVGPVDFYRRALSVEGERRFAVLTRS